MSQFIKLTKRIININHIERIYIDTSKYYIYFTTPSFSGFFIGVLGFVSSNDNENIVVCQKKDPEDYKTITNWINQIKPIN
jgi:hypothetical protein